jgi:large subunit ribosomal protein L28
LGRSGRKAGCESLRVWVGLRCAMARRCAVTGKGVQVGHNVSHANNKTKRRYLPNLQQTSVLSDVLGSVRLRITAAAIRTIEHKGGIDAFLRDTPDRNLSPEIRRLKRRVAAASARKSG